MTNIRWFVAGLLLLLFANAQAKQQQVVQKTFLDTMVFNYEKTLWGKDPINPLKPLGENHQTNLKDLSYYGVFNDAPMLSTDKTIFIDSAPPIPRTVKRQVPIVKDEHHSHIGIGAGAAGTYMAYHSDFGGSTLAFSPSFHFIYDYFLSRNWGFLVGLECSFTTGHFVADNYTDSYSFTDYEGARLNFKYNVGKLEEENKLINLTIPLMLGYSRSHWSGHAGIKIGVPLALKYKQTLSDCDFSCELPEYNTIITHAPALGIGDKTVKYEGEFSSRPVLLMFALDFGYRFHISKTFDLGAAVFFDQAFFRMSIKAKHDKNNEQYREDIEVYDFLRTSDIKNKSDIPAHLVQSSVLSGRNMTSGERLSEGLGYTSFGVRVTFYVNKFGKHYFTEEETEEMQQPFYGVSSEVKSTAFSSPKKNFFSKFISKKTTTTTTKTVSTTTSTTTKTTAGASTVAPAKTSAPEQTAPAPVVIPVADTIANNSVDTISAAAPDSVAADSIQIDSVAAVAPDSATQVAADTIATVVVDSVVNVSVDSVVKVTTDSVAEVSVDSVATVSVDSVAKVSVDSTANISVDSVATTPTDSAVVEETIVPQEAPAEIDSENTQDASENVNDASENLNDTSENANDASENENEASDATAPEANEEPAEVSEPTETDTPTEGEQTDDKPKDIGSALKLETDINNPLDE